MKINDGDTLRQEMLAGYYYQSDQLGKFLSWLKASPLKDNTIVVATGDHILKGFDDYLAPRQQFLKYAVPFYAYIPKALDALKTIPKDLVGSHEDIFPTLYELALSGEGYYAFGSPLMFNVADRSGWNEQDRYLFKEGVVASSNLLYPWEDKNSFYLKGKPIALPPTQEASINKIKSRIALKKYYLINEYERGKPEIDDARPHRKR